MLTGPTKHGLKFEEHDAYCSIHLNLKPVHWMTLSKLIRPNLAKQDVDPDPVCVEIVIQTSEDVLGS